MFTFEKFRELSESKSEETGESKTAVFSFGRFNPPTKGHEKMVNAVIRTAQERGGDAFIFPSPSYDKKKNPLQHQDKVVYMMDLFPNANIINDATIKNPFQAVGYLSNQGYTDIVLVVGSDRVEEFQKRFNRSTEYFDSFEIVSAGERDPDSGGVTGMSGTKAREAAIAGDIGKFRAATGWEGAIAGAMMSDIRREMGVE